jgi:nucleotide-binding universal stress UspA family protein
LRGVGEKEQRQYEHIKEEAKKEGRYRGREKEVAARTVLKQHKEKRRRTGEQPGRRHVMGTIVVGVDESAGSDTALRWAVAEARLRESKVRVVHVYQPPQPVTEAAIGAPAGMGVPVVAESADELRQAAEAEATRLIEEALGRTGSDSLHDLEIERAVLAGPTAQTLIESAQGAELLVVGSRGRGGFLGLLLGSVSQQCAHHPPCPLVILPPPDEAEIGRAR